MECISLIKEILTFKWGHALAIIKSWVWIGFHPSFLFHRRQNLDKQHSINNIYRKSIVMQYNLMGKKTFIELING